MNVLFVDQLAKTTCSDTLALADQIGQDSSINMEAYLAAEAELPNDRVFSVNITKGFYGAYKGSTFHKAQAYLKSLWELYSYIQKANFDLIHLQFFSLPWVEWLYVETRAQSGHHGT